MSWRRSTAGRDEQARAIALLDAVEHDRAARRRREDARPPRARNRAVRRSSCSPTATDRYSQVSAGADARTRAERPGAGLSHRVRSCAGAPRWPKWRRSPAGGPSCCATPASSKERLAASPGSCGISICSGTRRRVRPNPGRWHPIRVRVRNQEARGWRVRARDGYWATLEAAERMHMTGAKHGVAASKLAALVPLGDNLTSAVAHPSTRVARSIWHRVPPRTLARRPRPGRPSRSRQHLHVRPEDVGPAEVPFHVRDAGEADRRCARRVDGVATPPSSCSSFSSASCCRRRSTRRCSRTGCPTSCGSPSRARAAAEVAAATTAPNRRRRSNSRARSR